ncbi:MAG TPA: electron transfer flavoprotein subunit alpha/FixB family protein [Candidatus Limnocylindrales bacterium]|nr:electron transfer flavoprotein subunit alpha/FixB family protein [Candidatus Limnocylindrales bacterium]
MPRFWVVGEPNPDGSIARLSTEIATLARSLATAAGGEAVGVVVAAEPGRAASELAAFLPRVVAVADPAMAGHAWSIPAAERIAAVLASDADGFVLLGAGPDGRDLAGTLAVLTGRGVLANATAVGWDGRLVVEMGAFGGKLVTSSGFTGPGGIVTIRPNMITAEAAASPGSVEQGAPGELTLPVVAVVEQVEEAGAAAPIEEARIIVSGGRGVGGPDGFELVRELAGELGGAVGATRAAVDSGWIPYSQQIGQTGKIVKPNLYLALGISGAIQHKVGMQTAETIIAVNRDPDAPIAEFADLLVVGDLFEVGRALLVALRGRSG